MAPARREPEAGSRELDTSSGEYDAWAITAAHLAIPDRSDPRPGLPAEVAASAPLRRALSTPIAFGSSPALEEDGEGPRRERWIDDSGSARRRLDDVAGPARRGWRDPPDLEQAHFRGLSGSSRRRWLAVAGLAAIVALSVSSWLSWSGSVHPAPSAAELPPSAPAPRDGASIVPGTSTPLPVESPATPANDDAARDDAVPPPDPPPAADSQDSSTEAAPPAVKAVRSRTATKRARKKPAAPKSDSKPAAAPYDKTLLSRALSSVVQKAQQCDLWGRATGTAQLFVTFGPSGRVTGARLVGEPIASAAVSRCILHHARAAAVPPFDGPEFTVSRKITLR